MNKHTTSRKNTNNFACHKHTLQGALLTLMVATLSACSIDFENLHARQQVQEMTSPQGSASLGWQVFQSKCASCHGPDALGSSRGPDLVQGMREMGQKRFESLVLLRYDLSLPAKQAPADRGSSLYPAPIMPVPVKPAMPAWQTEPTVRSQIADVYAYLSGRAQGQFGLGQPSKP